MTAVAILVAVCLFAQDADRFRAREREHAGRDALLQAASQWEASEHDPARHLLAVEEIARDFLDSDPAVSLEYCRKVRSAPQLWPILFEAEVRLEDWPMAERYGEAVMDEIDAGRQFQGWADAPEAARLRRLYASTLDHLGERDAAAKQLALAATERDRRIPELRSEILASEIDQPSTPFRLPDRNGREIALADYRGRPVVAVFWATWCAPCVAELPELNRFFETHPGQFFSVSTDDDPAAPARFAREHGYDFPILTADRAVEHNYTVAPALEGPNVPQLYVFDSKGNVRFHRFGFEDDGMLRQVLEWMLDAAGK